MATASGNTELEMNSNDKEKSTEEEEPKKQQDEDDNEFFALIKQFVQLFGIFFFGYLVGYWGLSLSWLLLVALLLIFRKKNKAEQLQRVRFHQAVAADDKAAIKCSVQDLPNWVYFPDTERAEWLNRMLKQLWPYLSEHITTILKTQVEKNIDDIMPDYCKGFRFDKIDFGNVPLRLGSVKCYDENTGRDEIILDLELIYAGNSDINVRIKGIGAGIKDFQLYGILRVELKPLIKEMPLIGCVSAYFLNNPIIEFNLTNFADILDFPGLSEFLRKAIKDQFAKMMVLPNKFVMPMVNDLQTKSIKFVQPIGVIRLELIEATKLKKSDVGILGMGSSDPYVNIIIGNKEFRTSTIYNTVNPKWNFICETLVYFSTQSIDLEVMDEDTGSKDDFLGKSSFPMETVINEGSIDAWINLKETTSGKIHIRATSLKLEHSIEHLKTQEKESQSVLARYRDQQTENPDQPFGSVACLMIYLDSANNLPVGAKSICEPSPQVILTLGAQTLRSNVQNFTVNPIWEESFSFLSNNFCLLEDLHIKVIDTKNDKAIGTANVRMQSLVALKDMTLNDRIIVRGVGHNFDLNVVISLSFLKSPSVKNIRLLREDTIESEVVDNIPTLEDMVKATIEPFAKISGVKEDIIEISQHNRHNGKNHNHNHQNNTSNTNQSQQANNNNNRDSDNWSDGLIDAKTGAILSLLNDSTYPKLEVTINKLVEFNKLEIIVHKAINLRKINNAFPDPFIKLYTVPEHHHTKEKRNKTVTIKNTCNPLFEESFFVNLDEELESIKLVVCSATGWTLFRKHKHACLGFVEIFFNEMLKKNVSFTKWYDLEQQDD